MFRLSRPRRALAAVAVVTLAQLASQLAIGSPAMAFETPETTLNPGAVDLEPFVVDEVRAEGRPGRTVLRFVNPISAVSRSSSTETPQDVTAVLHLQRYANERGWVEEMTAETTLRLEPDQEQVTLPLEMVLPEVIRYAYYRMVTEVTWSDADGATLGSASYSPVVKSDQVCRLRTRLHLCVAHEGLVELG